MALRSAHARRLVAAIMVSLLAASGTMVVGEPTASWAGGRDRLKTTDNADKPVHAVAIPSVGSGAPDLVRPEPVPPLDTPRFPEPGAWTVTLGGKGQAAGGSADVGRPVEAAADADGHAGDELRITVYDRNAARRLGVTGFVFGVSRPSSMGDRPGRAADGEALPVRLSADYSPFADAYGGEYSDRLRVVSLPACALADPLPKDCSVAGVPLPTRNDRTAEKLVAEVENLAGGDGLFAITSGVSGEEGTFAATPNSPTGQWQVSAGSGEFSYTYDIDVPEPAGGTAPTVETAYSSGGIDGLTNASNTQAPATGLGWSQFDNAFIERRYEPCVITLNSSDLCWLNHNATLSLGSVSGTLLPINAGNTEWRVHSDAGWKVERLTGAANGDQGAFGDVGEYWKVTATDGSQYFFGLGSNLDTGEATNSAAMVPVFADHRTDPCWGNLTTPDQFGVCSQAWRWNLDRVVDPDGNVTTYHYDRASNRYAALNGFFNGTLYHRGTLLDRIEYGARVRDGSNPVALATVMVHFGRYYRCTTLDDRCTTQPNGGNASSFPDVPSDLICSDNTCTANAPSFFVTSRYANLTIYVVADGRWQAVTRYNLTHAFLAASSTERKKMYLQRIDKVGLTNPDDPLGLPQPPTRFEYTWLPNRVDVVPSEGRVPMPHARVSAVVNEFGGRVDVTYGQNRTCDATYRPTFWQDNNRDCFPQTMVDRGTRRVGVFHKYLVTRVVENGDGFLTNPMTTSYTYEDAPAWAFNYGAFAQYDHEWGWSGWRGYGTTLITQGAAKTRVQVFRGLEGDPLWVDVGGGTFCPCGHRTETVQAFDESFTDESRSFTDFPALQGRTLKEASYGTLDGVSNVPVQSTLHKYERRITQQAGAGQLRDAEWAGVSAVTESVATAPGQVRRRGGTTTYNARLQPEASLEAGWLDVPGDERCSRTTYAHNLTAWMFEYPARNVVLAGDCGSLAEVSVTETYYDGSQTLGALPGRGNPTRQRIKLDGASWAETTTGYDPLGRPVSLTDPNGRTTTTSYQANPAHGIPTQTTVTNPLGHVQTTQWLAQYQVPLRQVDANGNVTTYRYDGLGRLTNVALPTEQQTGMLENTPSWKFEYSPDLRVVKSRRMTSFQGGVATYEDSWMIYDGLGREWQSQQRSPASGQVLLTSTAYDDRGLVHSQAQPQAVTATPGTLLVPSRWDNETRTSYDEIGRKVREDWTRIGIVSRSTRLAYTADTVTVTGPDGGQVRETTDGLGRTVAVAEWEGSAWVTGTYGYDLADNLLSLTDPAGNRTTYTYDLAGRRLTQNDPNRGRLAFGYDAAGNQTSVVDGVGNAVHVGYDELNRPVQRRAGSVTGPLLASWLYDAAGQRGLPQRSVRHTAGGDWISEITGYDQRSRPLGTRLTVPAGIPGLSGQYPLSQTYDRADRATSVSYPAVGGLPAETVTTTYSSLGLPTTMSGLEPYVRATTYDNRGRLTAATLGPATAGGGAWLTRQRGYDADQQLVTAQTVVAGSTLPDGIVARHVLFYDTAGNLASQITKLNGQEWQECFQHDARQRLVRAHTVGSGATCASGQPGTGDRPYEHRFAYSPDGRLLSRSEVVNPGPGDAIRYGYPAPGGGPPQAPTGVGADTYRWDANGNLTTRTVGGQTETFTWDVERRLASVQGPAGTTSFVYDVDGQRLLRRTATGSTLYLAGHEITANADGSTVTGVRSYTFDGELIATRTPAGVSYLVTDAAGSVEMGIASGGQPTATRSYEPYGQVRADNGPLATDRRFLGQIEDSTTTLSYLQNRYYDTTVGVFTSADPVYDPKKIKSLNPYTYAAGNPTTLSDPTGLSPTYIHGLEVQNRALKEQNKQLRGHIKRLNGHIEELQRIIRRQQRAINQLITRIRALEAIIRQQQSIIRQLQARVNYLIGVVNAQRVIIGRLQAKIAYQQRIIRYQAGVIGYQRGIIAALVYHAFLPAYRRTVLESIESGNGIPLRMIHASWDGRDPMSIFSDNRPLVPAMWMGEPEFLGSRVVAAEKSAAGLGGLLGTAQSTISRLEEANAYHQAVRDELYAELHPTYDSFWDYVCNVNSVAGGGYSIWSTVRGSQNPYIVIGSAAVSIGCVLTN